MRKKQRTLRKIIRYRFDNLMSRGPGAMFLALFVVLCFIVFVSGITIFLVRNDAKGPQSFWDSIWWGVIHTVDQGTFTSPAFENTTKTLVYRLISVVVTFSGIFIIATVIAFTNTFFQKKLSDLQQGKSNVLENDFILILGWNDKILYILQELIAAGQREKGEVIVVLSKKDKIEMDSILSGEIKNRGKTRIITRSGDASSFSDLTRVNFASSRAIIILSPSNASSTTEEIVFSDSEVITIILAILQHPNKPEIFPQIVAEIYNDKNGEIIDTFSKSQVTVVKVKEVIAKIMAVTSRQSGLPLIYDNILSFKGSDVHFIRYEAVVGLSFGEIYNRFPVGYPLGIEKKSGEVILNPESSEIIEEEDRIVIITDDSENCDFCPDFICHFTPVPGFPSPMTRQRLKEKILVLGFNRKLGNMVKELDKFVDSGSRITIVSNYTEDQKEFFLEAVDGIKNLKVKLIPQVYADKKVLEDIEPFDFDIIFLMSRDSGHPLVYKSDADTIFTALVLNELKELHHPKTKTKMIAEILDVENKVLLQTAHVNDFIISNKIISNIISRMSLQKSFYNVFDELFREEGSEIYIKPVEYYFDEFPLTLNFYQIMERVFKRQEIAFGYVLPSDLQDSIENSGVFINPAKDVPITLNHGDKIIVLAENEK